MFLKNLNFLFLLILVFIFPSSLIAFEFEDNYQKANLLLHEKTYSSYYKSLAIFKELLDIKPNDYNTLWSVARVSYYLGSLDSDKGKKGDFFNKCIDSNIKAIEIDRNRVEAQFWLGLCYGKLGEVSGVFKGISVLDDIKSQMEKVLNIDPSYSHGGAYRMLGRIYNKLPWIMGGDNKKSIEYLKKAVGYDPEYPLNRMFLAETYLSVGELSLAEIELKEAIKYASVDENDEDLKEIVINAKKNLKDLKN